MVFLVRKMNWVFSGWIVKSMSVSQLMRLVRYGVRRVHAAVGLEAAAVKVTSSA